MITSEWIQSWVTRYKHCMKRVHLDGVFSGPYFPVFGLNTEIYGPNTGKYGPEKTPHLDTFHAVKGVAKIYINPFKLLLEF